MRILLLSTITAFALLLSSCEYKNLEDLNATVQLNFKANYDDELLLLEKEYLYGDDNMPIKFSQFNFYIADVALIRESGTEAELIDIGFVDFPYNLNQASDAEKGQVIQLKGIPTGKYVGIRIGFGVPADLNATKPNNYPSSNPLSMASHYWDGWNSYIFSKLEGKADMDFDGVFETNDGEGLAYHSGTDDVYTEKTFSTNIHLKEGETHHLHLNIDLKKLFLMTASAYDNNNDGYLDIQDFQSAHSVERLAISIQMMKNFSEATSISH